MNLHRTIENLILVGSGKGRHPMPVRAEVPDVLLPLVEDSRDAQRKFNLRAAIEGGRYRSAFWCVYLLSVVATAFAVTPLALGGESESAELLKRVCGFGEVIVIALVSLVYWLGHARDWQGQWLGNRTKAELAWYLPLVAPLVDYAQAEPGKSWYASIFPSDEDFYEVDELDAFCRNHFERYKTKLGNIWSKPAFVEAYARWALFILDGQIYYHRNNHLRHHHLLHRVHLINNVLFAATAIGAVSHLFFHAGWLSIMTAIFPALAAALHGALAQSESYRLASISRQLASELGVDRKAIQNALDAGLDEHRVEQIQRSIKTALITILNEHKDWHMLVHPHRLNLG
ncbi:MAG: hypothetical protein JOY60_04330 [Burkholderiaceae bacterium]|nr:hypothetical protein [Roseateles sp.]MBV8469074.1 hypothetical protein [Burkholderiaceae bacterium]